MPSWSPLPRELELRITSLLEPNEVADTMRLACKASAALLNGPRHTLIRLSQPVPPHALAHRWGRPGAMLSLPYKRRLQLLCLTAASGSVTNLEFLLPRVGCALTGELLAAAAGAGRLAVCRWLRQRGCPWEVATTDRPEANPWTMPVSAATAAGKGGHREVCAWLIAEGCADAATDAAFGAARGGHIGLVECLMPEVNQKPGNQHLLRRCIVEGCGLAILQHLHAMRPEGLAGQIGFGPEGDLGLTVDVAAGSPTPDWRDKVEWLEAAGYARGLHACAAAAGCPDALERLTWLHARGFMPPSNLDVSWVASRADLEALEHLCGEGGARGLLPSLACSASERGCLEVLQALHERGLLEPCEYGYASADADDDSCSWERVTDCAFSHGHLHVVAWLVETWGAKEVLTPWRFQQAPDSGNVELMAWLGEERGWSWGPGAYCGLAKAGCEEALEWLAASGCPVRDEERVGAADRYWGAVHDGNSGAYGYACSHGDLSTLACLRRLGIAPTAADLMFVMRTEPFPLANLRWLFEHGCPVPWDAAMGEAQGRFGAASEVVAWLKETYRQQAAAGRLAGKYFRYYGELRKGFLNKEY